MENTAFENHNVIKRPHAKSAKDDDITPMNLSQTGRTSARTTTSRQLANRFDTSSSNLSLTVGCGIGSNRDSVVVEPKFEGHTTCLESNSEVPSVRSTVLIDKAHGSSLINRVGTQLRESFDRKVRVARPKGDRKTSWTKLVLACLISALLIQCSAQRAPQELQAISASTANDDTKSDGKVDGGIHYWKDGLNTLFAATPSDHNALVADRRLLQNGTANTNLRVWDINGNLKASTLRNGIGYVYGLAWATQSQIFYGTYNFPTSTSGNFDTYTSSDEIYVTKLSYLAGNTATGYSLTASSVIFSNPITLAAPGAPPVVWSSTVYSYFLGTLNTITYVDSNLEEAVQKDIISGGLRVTPRNADSYFIAKSFDNLVTGSKNQDAPAVSGAGPATSSAPDSKIFIVSRQVFEVVKFFFIQYGYLNVGRVNTQNENELFASISSGLTVGLNQGTIVQKIDLQTFTTANDYNALHVLGYYQASGTDNVTGVLNLGSTKWLGVVRGKIFDVVNKSSMGLQTSILRADSIAWNNIRVSFESGYKTHIGQIIDGGFKNFQSWYFVDNHCTNYNAGGTICNTCETDYYRTTNAVNNECIQYSAFPPEHGRDIANNVLEKCQVTNCIDCQTDHRYCTTCASRYYLPVGIATSCTDINYFASGFGLNSDNKMAGCLASDCDDCRANNAICVKCKAGYYRNNTLAGNTCTLLGSIANGFGVDPVTNLIGSCSDSNCQNCRANRTICNTCISGFFRDTNSGTECKTRSQIPRGKGIVPGNDYFDTCTTGGCQFCVENSNVCLSGCSGIANCIRCSTATGLTNTCNLCASGFYRSADDLSCVAVASIPQGFGPELAAGNDQFKLKPCNMPNCKDCKDNYRLCNSCVTGYFRNNLNENNTCRLRQDLADGEGVSETANTWGPCLIPECKSCYFQMKTCNICDVQNCRGCSATDKTNCRECKAGYYLSKIDGSNQCVKKENFQPGFGADESRNLMVPCQDPNCLGCFNDFRQCDGTCKPNYFRNNINSGNKCFLKKDFPPKTGADQTNNLYQPCTDPNCVDCVDNFAICSFCVEGFFRDKIGTGNKCVALADIPAGNGPDVFNSIYLPCNSKDKNNKPTCSQCKQDYRFCEKCNAPLYRDSNGVDNQCVEKKDFPPVFGVDETNNLMRQCATHGCLDCTNNYATCAKCEATYVPQDKVPFCIKLDKIASPPKPDGFNDLPLQCSPGICTTVSDKLDSTVIKLKRPLTKEQKSRFIIQQFAIMNDNRICWGCGTAPYSVSINNLNDSITTKTGFTRRFPANKVLIRTWLAPPAVPIVDSSGVLDEDGESARLLQTPTPATANEGFFFESNITIDANTPPHVSEVFGWMLKVWNISCITGFMIIFPMSSYFINQFLAWVGHLRVLDGPLLIVNTIPIYYLSSNWIFPWYTPNPYYSRTEDPECVPALNFWQNGYRCNIIANFGHNFNIMLAALVVNLIVLTYYEGWRKRTRQEDEKVHWLSRRVRKYFGLRYFYQLMDAYSLELFGLSFIMFNNIYQKGENIVGFILAIFLILYYFVFYLFAIVFTWKVSAEMKQYEAVEGMEIEDLPSVYDSDLAFLVERYKFKQWRSFGIWMPVITAVKNFMIQVAANCLAQSWEGQLVPIFLFEFLFYVCVWTSCARRSVFDNLYDIVFSLCHLMYLLTKCVSTQKSLLADTIQGDVAYCCATCILILALTCLVHAFLIAIEYLIRLKREAPVVKEEGAKHKYESTPVA